jgi:hypothetical protein
MLNIKTLIAATLLSGVAAMSFAATPEAPKAAPAVATAAAATPAAEPAAKPAKKLKHKKAKKMKAADAAAK